MPDTTNRTTDAARAIPKGDWYGYDRYIDGKFEAGFLLDREQEPNLREVARFNARGIAQPLGEVVALIAGQGSDYAFAHLIHQAADVRETLFRNAKSDRTLDTEMRFECGRAVAIIGKLAARLMTEINTPPAPPKSATDLLAINRAWLDADTQKWGEFEKALDELVEAHS